MPGLTVRERETYGCLIALGAQRRPEMVATHHAIIAEATDLPLIAFNYPLASEPGSTPDERALVLLGTLAAVDSSARV